MFLYLYLLFILFSITKQDYLVRTATVNSVNYDDYSLLCSEGIPLLMQDHKPRPCQPRPWKEDQRCPSGFWCHEGDEVASYYCCPKSRKFFNHCHLPPVSGFGKENMRRFYYDWQTDGCHELTYSGIGGNENSYVTYEQCEKACRGAGEPPLRVTYENTTKASRVTEKEVEKNKESTKKKIIKVNVAEASATEATKTNSPKTTLKPQEKSTQGLTESPPSSTIKPKTRAPTTARPPPPSTVTQEELETEETPGGNPCTLPPEKGSNGGVAKKMWYFDLSMMSCVEFTYLGRNSNSNRFSSFHACIDVCGIGKPSRKSCTLPVAVGNGPYQVDRYFYNSVSNKCEIFLYSGANGNDNRFFKKHKCERLCIPKQPKKPKEVVHVIPTILETKEGTENAPSTRYPWPETRNTMQQNRYRTTEKIVETEDTTHPTLIFKALPSTRETPPPTTPPSTTWTPPPMTSQASNIDLIFQHLMTAPTRFLISMTEAPVYETTTPPTFIEIPERPVEQLTNNKNGVAFPIWETANNNIPTWETIPENPYENQIDISPYSGSNNVEEGPAQIYVEPMPANSAPSSAHIYVQPTPEVSAHSSINQQGYNYYNINQLKPQTQLNYVPYQPQLLERIPIVPAHLNGNQLQGSSTHLQGNSAHLQGNSAHLPGNSAHLQGNSAHLTGNSAHLQGNSAHLTGNSAHLQENSAHQQLPHTVATLAPVMETTTARTPAPLNGNRLHSWSTGNNVTVQEVPTYLAVNSRIPGLVQKPPQNSGPSPTSVSASELGELLSQIANIPISQIPSSAQSTAQQLQLGNNQVESQYIPYAPVVNPAHIYVQPLQFTTPPTYLQPLGNQRVPGPIPGSTTGPPVANNIPRVPKININIEEDRKQQAKNNLTIEIIENFMNSPCLFPLPTYAEPIIMCESKNSCTAGTFCQIGDGQSICCPHSCVSPCSQTFNIGTGVSQLSRWFYDKETKMCKTFSFKGFQGNSNNFLSYSDCERSCDAVTVCQHGPPSMPEYPNEECSSTNPCSSGFMCHSMDSWSFCCPMNPNEIRKEIDKIEPLVIPIVATNSKVPEQCDQPVNSGYGQSFIARYFYSREYDQCLHFVFTGEGGNPNNFASLEECLETCIANGVRFSSLGVLSPSVFPSVIPSLPVEMPALSASLAFLPAPFCPKGLPLQDHTGNTVYCSNNKDCPYDHVCRVQDNRAFCCPAPESFCLQKKPVENNCQQNAAKANQVRFTYDAAYDKCVRLEFSNCGSAPSSLNFFTSQTQCRRLCCNQGLNLVYKRKMLMLSDDPLPEEEDTKS